jgi:hypothetical protein
VHTLAGLLKLWLRAMSEPLMNPSTLKDEWLAVKSVDGAKLLVSRLSSSCGVVLAQLFALLADIAANVEQTKMSTSKYDVDTHLFVVLIDSL